MLDPKGIDFVIPLGRGSQFSNCELRYCLRSLERYAKGVRRVVIVGHDPGFLSDKVTVLPCPDFPISKEARIAVKVQWAFENHNLSDEILFGNDDYFFTQEFDARTVPFFQRGTLLEDATRHKTLLAPGETWRPDPAQILLQATHDALVQAKMPAFSYELHFPIRYQRKIYCEKLNHWWELSGKAQFGIAPKSVYGNYVCRKKPGPFRKDLKLARYFGEADVAKRLAEIPERCCFSYGDQAIYEGFELWLYNRFPEKSQFES